MNEPGSTARLGETLALSTRAVLAMVLTAGTLNWVGWAAGIPRLTRVLPDWPAMTPWTALQLGALAAALLLQSGHPSARRVWVGRALAGLVLLTAGTIAVEFATGTTLGVDTMWFGDAVRAALPTWPGRPSTQTTVSILLVAGAVALTRVDRRWSGVVWPAFMAAGCAVPLVSIAAYLFDATALVRISPTTGQSLIAAASLLLLIGATAAARPDRNPLAWLLARPDRRSLIRLLSVLAGFPVVVALSRAALLGLGVRGSSAWTLSIAVGTTVIGAMTFYLSQREQILLIQQDLLSRERADAERRYRILAENAVDIVVHLRGTEVAWVSPSVEDAFGGRVADWIGSDFVPHIHRHDIAKVADVEQRIAGGRSVLQRFRVRTADGKFRWVDGHAKLYIDPDGKADGMIAALRVVDDQVEAEQRLERLARFDALTGLVNRAEAIARLQLELERPRASGTQLGILYCDVDHFKEINDTWGHGVGDTVLTTLAHRIVECVRPEDTVGRTGGDEIIVLLPGVHDLDEAVAIAEKICLRAAEPIYEPGNVIRASLSIGATIAVPGEPISVVTARADAAMYQAKLGTSGDIVRIEAAK